MTRWTQEEIESMRLADEQIEGDFCMTLDEIAESKERDTEILDGQLDFAALRRMIYNRAYSQRYYEANKRLIAARNKMYYDTHREREKARSREWRERNAQYTRVWQKAYYEENRAFILAKKQASAEVDRAYSRILREMEAEA